MKTVSLSKTQKAGMLVIPLENLDREDVEISGGKSSSLGAMIQDLEARGVRVRGGFSTTSLAYYKFLDENGLTEKIADLLRQTDVQDDASLAATGKQIRSLIMGGVFSEEFTEAMSRGVARLLQKGVTSVAVRSSATAEDLPDASFAGQQETFLNVPVNLTDVLYNLKRVIASLFGDRAIFYREEAGYAHTKIALCACVQEMVRSDLAVAGVGFSVDSESGHDGVVGITAVWGLGELAVNGSNTDEFVVGKPKYKGAPTPVLKRQKGRLMKKLVFSPYGSRRYKQKHYTKLVSTTAEERSKFTLDDADLSELARLVVVIQEYFGRPMDTEWAKDGIDGKIYFVQARPVTVNKEIGKYIETFNLAKGDHKRISAGTAIGYRIASGTVRILKDSSPGELEKVKKGDILVARMTDPNYGPALGRASAIITQEGSTKCHAAIIAREQQKAAIVASEGILHKLSDGQMVTVCCSEGTTGIIYEGAIPFAVKRTKIGILPELRVKLKMNVGDPGQALQAAMLPNAGTGLSRQEFIIMNLIGIHPAACLAYPHLDTKLNRKIEEKIVGYKNPRDFYVRKLAEGIGLIACAFAKHRVVIRLSDFKTNEYCDLIGGSLYEPKEANPMIGFRGAARYIDPKFQKCFEMECEALQIVREEMALTNVDIMVPFVRTLQEGRRVKALLAKNGLKSSSGEKGLRIGMMCELPSNVILAEQFARIFDFASIGSNDLCQLTLGADRDSGCDFGDERDLSVKMAIVQAITAWKKAGKPIGICGQAPSDHKGYAEFLAEAGIDSMSLNPDSVVGVWKRLARREASLASSATV